MSSLMSRQLFSSLTRIRQCSLSGFRKFTRTASLPTADEAPTKTMADVEQLLIEKLGVKLEYQPVLASREHLIKFLPKTQSELPTRTMQDSFDSAIIPLKSNSLLRNRYVTFLDSVRVGRLLEDLDVFAAWLSYKHIDNPLHEPGCPAPHVIVTLLVDEITFTSAVPMVNEDIRLSGHVTWAGTSSLETTIWLDQMMNGEWTKLTKATFLMVSRNSCNTGPAFVNPLKPSNEKEELLFQKGERNRIRRMKMQKASLLHVPPSSEELLHIHEMYTQTLEGANRSFLIRVQPERTKWLRDAGLRTIVFCHPESRNPSNKVFGGFIMRQAYELGWANAFFVSTNRPRVLHMSDIRFRVPVDVSSMMRLTSYVTYTEKKYLQVLVCAEFHDPFKGKLITSNDLHFTFEVAEEVIKVLPKTYNEAMMYLDGRRYFQEFLGREN